MIRCWVYRCGLGVWSQATLDVVQIGAGFVSGRTKEAWFSSKMVLVPSLPQLAYKIWGMLLCEPL